MTMSYIPPLQTLVWSGALGTADLLRRCGVALRRMARVRLASLRRAAPTHRPVDPAEAAADVRALAMRHLDSDPRFAAELFAAAARHAVEGA